MCFCWFKIVYYIILIGYQLSDIGVDIDKLVVLTTKGTFSEIHVANSSLPYEAYLGLLLTSCVAGGIFSVAMSSLYVYYICHHFKCIEYIIDCKYMPVKYHEEDDGDDEEKEGTVSLLIDTRCKKKHKCNRRVVKAELILSLLELYFKDDLQSILLFLVYNEHEMTSRPDLLSIVFSVYSIVAHSKLFVCFLTKILGWGHGERAPKCEDWKFIVCMLGCLGSVVFQIFNILYLVQAMTV